MKRYGQIIRLKEGALNEYASYHANVWPEVLKTIAACGNFTIFHRNGQLFAHLKYHGDNFVGAKPNSIQS